MIERFLWRLFCLAIAPLEAKSGYVAKSTRIEQTADVLRLVREPEKPSQPPYDPGARPGVYDFGSIDCPVHGDNVGGYRAHKAGGPRYCCMCALGEPGPARAAGDFERTGERMRAARKALGWLE